MEPPLITDSTFSSANPSSYTLSEIWPPVPPPPSSSSSRNNNNNNNNKRSNPIPNENDSAKKHAKLGEEESPDETASFKKAEEADSSSAAAAAAATSLPGKPWEPPKQDYIHVRARRGQATDSHSLAERARREKISERMKILQDLVPGCNKVIGKALVLDEIINYIQSLQRQVEFLSMKLEAVNSRLNMNSAIECFPSKDVGTQPFDLSGIIFGSQAARGYAQGSQPGWLHMQITGAFNKAT